MPPRSPQARHPVSDKAVERLSVSFAADYKVALREIAAEKRSASPGSSTTRSKNTSRTRETLADAGASGQR